jgi:fermentation-respiration switch protein FrsA (DUF1100 family)
VFAIALAVSTAVAAPVPAVPPPAPIARPASPALRSDRSDRSVAPTAPLVPGENRVTFVSEGDTLVGRLYLPASYREGQRLPVVVVTGPWTTVKEQVPARYAQKLADAGLAAMTFDFRGFGESQGGPRAWESAARKVADLRHAAEYAGALSVTARDARGPQVGGLAICFGAGFMARTIAEGAPYRAFATVAAWLHDPETLERTFGAAEIARRWRVGRAAAAEYARTGRVEYVPAASSTDKAAAMYQVDYYSSAARGLVPQYDNRYAVMGWPEWLALDGIGLAPAVRVPTTIVHSDGSALPANVRTFYATLATPAADKHLVWLKGNHTDFYDREPYVAQAADAVARHFARTLGGTRTAAH